MNSYLHLENESLITIAIESTGYPTICRKPEDNGLGFNYRSNPKYHDIWRHFIKKGVNLWRCKYIASCLSIRRYGENQIAYLDDDEDKETLLSCISKNTSNDKVISLYNIIQISTTCMAGEGNMTYIGSESNDFDINNLKDDDNKYIHPIRLITELNDLDNKINYLNFRGTITYCNEIDKLIVLERGRLEIIINLSDEDIKDLEIGVSNEGKYKLIISISFFKYIIV